MWSGCPVLRQGHTACERTRSNLKVNQKKATCIQCRRRISAADGNEALISDEEMWLTLGQNGSQANLNAGRQPTLHHCLHQNRTATSLL